MERLRAAIEIRSEDSLGPVRYLNSLRPNTKQDCFPLDINVC
jgi:hypothetical protein